MDTPWRPLIEEAGAVWDGWAVQDFGNPAAELAAAATGEIASPLTADGFVAAAGDDVTSMLQGQLTNDVAALAGERSQLSAWCSPKGRVVNLFRLFRDEERVYLQMPRRDVENVLARLRMYVLRARVDLSDASSARMALGIAGPDAPRLVAEHAVPAPAQPDQVTVGDGLAVIRLAGPVPRFQALGTPDTIGSLWRRLRGAGVQAVGAAPWTLLEIRAGIPSLDASLQDTFIPQMLNLQAINGLSFDKGCYVGQEIVARTQYLGRLKRRLHLARVETDVPPQPGDPIYAPDSSEAGAVGAVACAAPSPEGGFELLAVVHTAIAASHPLCLRQLLGERLELTPLPYALDAEAA
jgi:folate-binding protein YgfZ